MDGLRDIDSLYLVFAPPVLLAVCLLAGLVFVFHDKPIARRVYLIALVMIIPMCAVLKGF